MVTEEALAKSAFTVRINVELASAYVTAVATLPVPLIVAVVEAVFQYITGAPVEVAKVILMPFAAVICEAAVEVTVMGEIALIVLTANVWSAAAEI